MRLETFFIVYREPQFSSRFKVQGLKFNAQQRVQSSSILPTEGGGAAVQSSKFKVQVFAHRLTQIFTNFSNIFCSDGRRYEIDVLVVQVVF